MLACSGVVRETHYFRSTPSETNTTPNYFRVTITARAHATKIRYLSGYFDEKAVEQYFSEFTQPSNLDKVIDVGELAQPGETKSGEEGDSSADEAPIKAIDDKLENRQYVLLLSTNVDDIAAQIGALAENLQVQEALTGIANKDTIQANHKAQTKLAADRERARQLYTITKDVGGKVKTTVDPVEVLRLANELARYLGSTERFDDMSKASAWLTAHRDFIMAELEAEDE